MQQPPTVDAYIQSCPAQVQPLLQQIRAVIKKTAPDAVECISYGMPTYKQGGVLAHFAAFKNHIGFYATPSAHGLFAEALSGYKTGRGSVQFPLNQPMPLKLIEQMLRFKLQEQAQKAKPKNGRPGKS